MSQDSFTLEGKLVCVRIDDFNPKYITDGDERKVKIGYSGDLVFKVQGLGSANSEYSSDDIRMPILFSNPFEMSQIPKGLEGKRGVYTKKTVSVNDSMTPDLTRSKLVILTGTYKGVELESIGF